jgi:hypothetical protein
LRRFSAILLLFLFGLALLSPLWGSDYESSLPACCRRGGKHHCAMAGGSSGLSSGPAFRNDARCPAFPGFVTGTFVGATGIVRAVVSEVALTAQRVSCASFELRVLSSLRLRAHAKRGPPALV